MVYNSSPTNMKKLFLLVMAVAMAGSMFAQHFVGQTKTQVSFKYEDQFDVMVETYKKGVNESPVGDPVAKGMALMMAKPIIKGMLKRLETEKYLTSFPDGDYTNIAWIDAANNRYAYFCPELGRLLFVDCAKGVQYIAFPKIGVAAKYTFAPQQAYQVLYTKAAVRNSSENVTEINGIPCLPAITLLKYADVGGEMVDTVTYNGELCVMMPAAGFVHNEYQSFVIQQDEAKETHTSHTEVVALNEVAVDDSNFVFPESDYKMLDGAKLAKEIKKRIKKGTVGELTIPFDGDHVGKTIWDVAK